VPLYKIRHRTTGHFALGQFDDYADIGCGEGKIWSSLEDLKGHWALQMKLGYDPVKMYAEFEVVEYAEKQTWRLLRDGEGNELQSGQDVLGDTVEETERTGG